MVTRIPGPPGNVLLCSGFALTRQGTFPTQESIDGKDRGFLALHFAVIGSDLGVEVLQIQYGTDPGEYTHRDHMLGGPAPKDRPATIRQAVSEVAEETLELAGHR